MSGISFSSTSSESFSSIYDCQSRNSHFKRKTLLTAYSSWRYIYYFFFGLAYMAPWTVFISINSYFQRQFKGSRFVDNFQNYFSIIYMSTMLFCVTLIVHSIKRVNNSQSCPLTLSSPFQIEFILDSLCLILFLFLRLDLVSLTQSTQHFSSP